MWFSKTSAYRNVPKFSDRRVWANSADPDQTAPLPYRLHRLDSLVEPHSSNFIDLLQQIFWVSEYLGNLRCVYTEVASNKLLIYSIGMANRNCR